MKAGALAAAAAEMSEIAGGDAIAAAAEEWELVHVTRRWIQTHTLPSIHD